MILLVSDIASLEERFKEREYVREYVFACVRWKCSARWGYSDIISHLITIN